MTSQSISTCDTVAGMETTYTDKNGKTKYYATYQSAWKAAARLNETAVDGLWFFEMDTIGWFVFFVPDAI